MPPPPLSSPSGGGTLTPAPSTEQHGHSSALIGLSHYKHARRGGEGTPPGVTLVACPDTYRGAHAGREDAGRLYAEDVNVLGYEVDATICPSCVQSGTAMRRIQSAKSSKRV